MACTEQERGQEEGTARSTLKRRRAVTTLTVLGDRDDGGGGRGAEGDFHALRDKVDERGVAPAELAVGQRVVVRPEPLVVGVEEVQGRAVPTRRVRRA